LISASSLPHAHCSSPGGFWIRETSQRETPYANFRHELLIEARGVDGTVLAWSTYANLNALLGSALRPAFVSVRW
jgi:hypothetical protein